MIGFEEFEKLTKSADLIPVFRRRVADTETPVSVLARFAEDENVFLLESVESAERFGRYSFLGLNPRGVFTVERGKPYFRVAGGEKKELPIPPGGSIMALRELLNLKKHVPALQEELPPLFAGAVGFLGYETVNSFEKLPDPVDPPEIESAFMICNEMIVFDNVRHTMMLVVTVHSEDFPTARPAYDYAVKQLDALEARLNAPAPEMSGGKYAMPCLESNLSKTDFIRMVEAGKQHIFDGDVIQLVLSQKFSAKCAIPPLTIYRALRLVNPSPYTFYLKLGETRLIGSSPETLAKREGDTLALRPIAGTRKRGATPAADRNLADELLRDEKERAEHLMLVDLARNDAGRVAVPGSVQVRDFMTVERYSHVMHLVSTVEAAAQPGADAFDLLRASFPAGTLSGAPKVRAMELIAELENRSRGVYGGAVGYFSCDGNMDLAITIRTIEYRDGSISVQAGAGIVFDSDPESEYNETVNKAAALVRSLELAAGGFQNL